MPTLGRIAYVFAAFVGSAFLGLALTFAPPLYGYYEAGPSGCGASRAAQDQNLGGILMTTEQALVFFAMITWLLVRLFREEDEAERALQARQRAQGLLYGRGAAERQRGRASTASASSSGAAPANHRARLTRMQQGRPAR